MATQSARRTNFLCRGERGLILYSSLCRPQRLTGSKRRPGSRLADYQSKHRRGLFLCGSRTRRELQDEPLEIEPSIEGIDAEEFDPFQRPEIAAVRAMIGDLCLALPEVTPNRQFGAPCFRAGKKNFCTLHFCRDRLALSVWAGGQEQALRTADPQYRMLQ